jgi:hypothetical protein
VGGKWRAHQVAVTLGLANANYVEIKSGLNEGDQVIYRGQEGLLEGTPVTATLSGASDSSTPAGAGTTAKPASDPPSGKVYICPMHPEVKSDQPGKCPKCGMALMPQEGKKAPAAREDGGKQTP